MAWSDKKGLLDNRRSTIPFYRDIRDRSTWELIDVMYYNIKTVTEPPNAPPDRLEIPSLDNPGVYFVSVRRILGKDDQEQYTFDGTLINVNGYNIPGSVSGPGTNNFQEDIHIILPGNSAMLSAYAQFEQTGTGSTTTVAAVVFVVTTATGPWSQATNLLITYDNETGERVVRVLRALN
jgi:hypothetical protein